MESPIKAFIFCVVTGCVLLQTQGLTPGEYTADWDSLDQHELPGWYDELKFGVFIHWGPYTVQAKKNEWMWYYWQNDIHKDYFFANKLYGKDSEYNHRANRFKAMNYDTSKWLAMITASGAKYVIMTSKLHDGYTLWPSKYSFGWNAKDMGPHFDLLYPFVDCLRRNSQLVFGLHYSMVEYYHPLFMAEKSNNLTTNSSDYVKMKVIPELKELVTNYKPNILWSYGTGGGSSDYYQSKEFLAWLYNESPVRDSIAVNDRWGEGPDDKKHGDFYYFRHNGYMEDDNIDYKWETIGTIDKKGFGYRPGNQLKEFRSAKDLIGSLVRVVAMGGNYLLNVSPNMYGTIEPVYEERLRDIGAFLGVNGDAIYKTRPWIYRNETGDSGIWYTSRNNSVAQSVYAIVLNYPKTDSVKLFRMKKFIRGDTTIRMLGFTGQIDRLENENSVTVKFPSMFESLAINRNAWAFEFTNKH